MKAFISLLLPDSNQEKQNTDPLDSEQMNHDDVEQHDGEYCCCWLLL